MLHIFVEDNLSSTLKLKMLIFILLFQFSKLQTATITKKSNSLKDKADPTLLAMTNI